MALTPRQIGVLIAGTSAAWVPRVQYATPMTEEMAEAGKEPPVTNKAEIVRWFDTAIAICLAESGGNPRAKNPGSSASGLWQIMVSAHGDKIKTAIAYWEAETSSDGLTIFDPRVNTEVAAMVYQEKKGFTPWEVYTKPEGRPAYRAHLGHGEAVYKYLHSPAVIKKGYQALIAEIDLGHAQADLIGALGPGGILAAQIPDPIQNAIAEVLNFLKDAGITIGVFIAGVILVILGAWFLLSQSKAGKAAIKTAKKATPVGKLIS